jgi:hypothetical protein
LLLILGNVDWVFAYYFYLSEDGFMHLRYVRLIEKDGRKDGKREPLYFISHELDKLRYYSSLDRDEVLESRKKCCLAALFLAKALLYLTNLEWFGCLLIPQVLFLPEGLVDWLQADLAAFEKKAREELRLMGHRIGEEFDKFEIKRLRMTAAASLTIVLLLPAFTLRTDRPSASLLEGYFGSMADSLFSVLATTFVGKLLFMTPKSMIKDSHFILLRRAVWLTLLLLLGIFNQNKTPCYIILVMLFFGHKEKLGELFASACSTIAILYSSLLGHFDFGLLDFLFVATLVFLHQVGKYKPGAVRLSNLFTFM